jgi:hypothetical protein
LFAWSFPRLFRTAVEKIMICGRKNDGTYIVEFKTADGEALGYLRRHHQGDAAR